MTRRDEDKVLVSRAADLELLRVVEEAERSGQGRRVAALRHLAEQAAYRSRAAIGITVRRRA